MSPEIHQRVRKLFDAALELPEGARRGFLETACAGEPEALEAVIRLLDVDPLVQSFLTERAAPGMQRVGRYLVSRELGRGAMGVVYEAVDPLIGRDVAVKVIHPQLLGERNEADFMRDRLFREARSAGQLLHPGIVIIFDVGQEGELAYIAMERVEGQSIQQILSSGQGLQWEELFSVLRQTAAALDHAHTRNIVHCDVKPGNIMLDKSGTVKLTDFGISKIASTQSHTRTGVLMGTPGYMSPEQIEGVALDGRSDQFSLAVVAFQLLTGQMPFVADSIPAMAYAIVHGPRPIPTGANPRLPQAINPVFARALDKDRNQRYPSCAWLVTALDEACNGRPATTSGQLPVIPPPPISVELPPSVQPAAFNTGTGIPVVPAKKSSGAAIWLVAGAAVVVLAAVGGYMAMKQPSSPAPVPAPPQQAKERTPPAPVERPPAEAAAPAVVQFVADPPSIKSGASAKLRWTVTGATMVTINPGVGKVDGNGAADVSPNANMTYTLTATSASGKSTTESVVLNVGPGAPKPPDAAALFDKAVVERKAKHMDAALPLYVKASEMGEVRAMLALGTIYEEGEDGVKQDYGEALRWFRTAADKGNSTSMIQLGGMYYMGEGVPKDSTTAASWFEKASQRGDAAGKYDLGIMYENGRGVPKDLAKARQLYLDAATLGNEEARKRILQLPNR